MVQAPSRFTSELARAAAASAAAAAPALAGARFAASRCALRRSWREAIFQNVPRLSCLGRPRTHRRTTDRYVTVQAPEDAAPPVPCRVRANSVPLFFIGFERPRPRPPFSFPTDHHRVSAAAAELSSASASVAHDWPLIRLPLHSKHAPTPRHHRHASIRSAAIRVGGAG